MDINSKNFGGVKEVTRLERIRIQIWEQLEVEPIITKRLKENKLMWFGQVRFIWEAIATARSKRWRPGETESERKIINKNVVKHR